MRYLVLAMVVALSACTMGGLGRHGGGKAAADNPITGGDVSVTALSGPPGAAAGTGASKAPPPNPSRPQPAATSQDQPDAKPDAKGAKPAETAPAAEAAAEEPKPEPPPSSPEEAACRKKGGQWSKVGKVGHTCVQATRDAGKSCTKASQCEGLCLARSGTCAPIAPLFGCNEILQNDGSQVTLCID